MSKDFKPWYGRIGYDREGIVVEHEFKTKAEAEAYMQGALDMKEQCDLGVELGHFSPLEDYWAVASNEESFDE